MPYLKHGHGINAKFTTKFNKTHFEFSFSSFYLHKQPSKLARSHGIYFATRVYTPG